MAAKAQGDEIASRLLALLAERKGGVRAIDARSLLHASQNGICRAAKQLEDEGRIVRMKIGFTHLMCLPQQAPAVRMAMREEIEARAARRRLQQAESRKRLHEATKHWHPVQTSDIEEPVHRTVAAEKAAPLRKLGVASVWELAA